MLIARHAVMRRLAGLVVLAGAAGAASAQQVPDFGDALPRHQTPAEILWAELHPTVVPPVLRGPGTVPTGPLSCPGEYHPSAGIIFAYPTGSPSGWLSIVRTMVVNVTTIGEADAYIVFETLGDQNTALGLLTTAGANMARVKPIIINLDSIWMRDYGPRFTYEGGVRVIADHTYNYASGRPNDNNAPIGFANATGFMRYTHPISHGGGNFHLNSLGQGNATQLLNSDNPGMSSAQIIASFQQYWGVTTYLHAPFRTSIDGTRHIDMWMQVVDHDKVMVSDFPLATNSNTALPEDQICDNVANTIMPSLGYQVFRIPAVGGTSAGGVHYTFTNVVMCNDLVLIPSYTNATAAQYNDDALLAYQTALPTKNIVQVPCQAIVTASGVMHCIVMHLPVNSGGENPVAYVKGPNAGGVYTPGNNVNITWLSDDDVDVTAIDIHLSLDDGGSWSPIVLDTADDRTHTWTVPDVYSTQARIRVTAKDAGGRTGSDTTDLLFTINGTQTNPCPVDFNNSGEVTVQDVYDFLAQWNFGSAQADYNAADGVTVQDVYDFLADWTNGCP